MMARNVVIAAAAAVVAVSALMATIPEDDAELAYGAHVAMRGDLERAGVAMSSPVVLRGDAASQHCSFFGGAPPPHCESTELEDASGEFLGNIHMVGTPEAPQAAVGVVKSDAELSQRPYLAAVASTMVERLVCRCWPQLSPEGFGSVSEWADDAALRRAEAGGQNLVSRVDGLPLPVLMEATATESGYEWKILVGTPP